MASNPYSMPDQQVAPPSATSTTKIVVIVCVAVFVLMLMCMGVLAALLIPAVSAARTAARYAMVSNQMKQIGLAMHNYHSTYQQLPPAFATDSRETPLRSWRVTIMPFAEDQSRWEQWNQDQPWDSVDNSELHAPPPEVYVSPFDADPAGGTDTHVFAVRHPDGLMSGDPQVTFRDATDGLSNTLLAVYLPHRTTHWAAPEDISLQGLQAELGSVSPADAVVILFGDGAVERVTSPMDPATVEAMVTRNGGETVSSR